MSKKTTKDIIKEMLTENTGKHFLDSGGAYGRNYERNQGRDFDSESPISLNFRIYNHNNKGELEIKLTLNLYHYLSERVDYNLELDELFYGKYLEENDSDDKNWFELVKEFPAWLEKQTNKDDELIYGGM